MRTRQSAFVVALTALAGTAAAQSFVNGNFETGDLSGWTVQPYSSNSVGVPGTVTSIDIDGPGPLGSSQAAAFMVGLAVFAPNEQGGIEMIQTLNLQSGVQYLVNFDWSTQRTAPVGQGEGGVFSLIVDNTAVHTVAAGFMNNGDPLFGHFSASFTAGASGPVEVGIRITRPYVSPGDLTQYVDNVVITSGSAPCYANCDGSTTQPLLTVADFGCFLNRFSAGDSYANCDGSTTAPVLTVADFGCFLNAFSAGCT